MEQRSLAREHKSSLIAALRADLHNISGRYQRTFQAADFMADKPGGAHADIEARAQELIAQGVPPAAAAAMASSTQTKEHNLYVLDSVGRAAAAAKKKNRRMA